MVSDKEKLMALLQIAKSAGGEEAVLKQLSEMLEEKGVIKKPKIEVDWWGKYNLNLPNVDSVDTKISAFRFPVNLSTMEFAPQMPFSLIRTSRLMKRSVLTAEDA